MSVYRESFGFMPDGREIFRYVLENARETQAHVITLGATLQSFILDDKDGDEHDVLLGFDDVEGYLTRSDYQGAIVGPVANRVSKGELPLGGKTYELVKNEKGITCLHGNGEFNTAVWDAVITDADAVELTYVSPDGEGGFPGEKKITVTYRLTDDNALHISYRAVSDRDTYFNITNHAYFNLNGFDGGDVLDHLLCIHADAITEADADSIPTGKILPVEGTPFDFNTPKKIGRDIGEDNEQLRFGLGYDHNFCLSGEAGTLREIATAESELTGIKMYVYTDLPGVQFYTGNFLDGSRAGKDGLPMEKRSGFCLETQYYPDTPHRPEFPSCLFKAGEEWTSETVYRFEVR